MDQASLSTNKEFQQPAAENATNPNMQFQMQLHLQQSNHNELKALVQLLQTELVSLETQIPTLISVANKELFSKIEQNKERIKFNRTLLMVILASVLAPLFIGFFKSLT